MTPAEVHNSYSISQQLQYITIYWFLYLFVFTTIPVARTMGSKYSDENDSVRNMQNKSMVNLTWRSWIRASWYNYENNQQDALYILI